MLSYHTIPYLVLYHHTVPYLILPSKVLLEEEGEEVQEVQNKLERERRTRMALEERVRLLEGQLYQVDSRFQFLDSNYKSIPGSGR